MITIALSTLTGVPLAWCLYRYSSTGQRKWLVPAGQLMLSLAFVLTMRAGVSAVLYGGEDKIVVVAYLLFGAAAALILAGRDWQGRLATLLKVFIACNFSIFLSMSLAAHATLIVGVHASEQLYKALPEAKSIEKLSPEQKEELSRKLAGALAGGDRFVRIGALNALLLRLPEYSAAALPALGPLLASDDPETRLPALRLIKVLGGAAAPLLPELKDRLAKAPKGSDTYTLEQAIKIASTAQPPVD